MIFLGIVGLKNRQIKGNFNEIFVGCQMIFDEKMRLHTTWNLYCQIKVTFYSKTNHLLFCINAFT